MAFSAADLEPAKDRKAFAEEVRKLRVANFLAGVADNPSFIRPRIKDGIVAGGWGLNIDQAAEYLGKAADLAPGETTVRAAVQDYLLFLGQLEKAIPTGQFGFALEAMAKHRPQIQAVEQRLKTAK